MYDIGCKVNDVCIVISLFGANKLTTRPRLTVTAS